LRALLDATAELSCEPQGLAYRSLPLLDLVAPAVLDVRRDQVEQRQAAIGQPLRLAGKFGGSVEQCAELADGRRPNQRPGSTSSGCGRRRVQSQALIRA
ncbi:hypothetical protein ACV335_30845, partial [Pseudomonas aeruginosa]